VGLERLMTPVQKTSGFRETHDTSSRDEWVERDSRHKFKRQVGLERLITQVHETSGFRETQVHETSGFRETHDTSSRDEWV